MKRIPARILAVLTAVIFMPAPRWQGIHLRRSYGGARKKPNILILWGDDIGWNNPSCYHRGMMGYQTPNIDRIAKEGALFTDWYGQQSCTAGRAAFITGQSPLRTGLLKVGLPGQRKASP